MKFRIIEINLRLYYVLFVAFIQHSEKYFKVTLKQRKMSETSKMSLCVFRHFSKCIHSGECKNLYHLKAFSSQYFTMGIYRFVLSVNHFIFN